MKKITVIIFSILTIIPVFAKKLHEDTGTINLARTNLALVSASSCNGDRPFSNKFYGILNAFDGGKNIVNNINYSYWLGNCNEGQWIEVEFSCPVSLTSLVLEGSSQCNATLFFEKGGEKVFNRIVEIVEPTKISNGMIAGPPPYSHKTPDLLPTMSNSNLKFEEVMNGVMKVRLTFTGINSQLSELKIMGLPPNGKEYKAGKPRLKLTQKDALLEANDLYRVWLDKTFNSQAVDKEVTETKESYIYIYKKKNKELLKVTVDKKSGIGRIEKRKTDD